MALAVWRFRRFGRLLACARTAPPAVTDRAAALAAQLGIRRAIRVHLLPAHIPPMLWPQRGGPLLLMPESLLADLRADELDALLVHEFAPAAALAPMAPLGLTPQEPAGPALAVPRKQRGPQQRALDEQGRVIEDQRRQLHQQELELARKQMELEAQAEQTELRAEADRLRAGGDAERALRLEKQAELGSACCRPASASRTASTCGWRRTSTARTRAGRRTTKSGGRPSIVAGFRRGMMPGSSLPNHCVSFETSRPAAARGKSRVGLVAALLLTCACTDTGRSPGAAAGGGSGASPAIDDAAAHLARAEEARDREEYDLARQEAEKARDLSGNDGNWEAHVRARNLLGGAASSRGDYEAALDELNATLAMAREKLGPGHPEVAHSHYRIGSVYVSTGRLKEGLEHLEKALALRRAAGGAQTKEVAAILVRMGLARSEQGEDERALPLFDEAAAIGRALPDKTGLTRALIGRGNALWGAARYDEAIEALDEAVRLLEAAKPRRGASLASAYANLGTVYWSKSDYDEALVYYEKALPLQVAAYGEAHHYVGIVHYNIATLRLMKRDYDACIASAERALEVLVPVLGERHSQVAQVYNAMGGALTGKGEVDRGLGVLQKALAVQLTLPAKGDRNAAVIYSSLADAYQAKGDLDRALPHYRRALAIDLSIYGEHHPDVAEDYVNLGDLHLKKGEEARALLFYAKAIAANTPGPTKASPDLDPPLDSAFSDEFLLKALKGAARARYGAKRADPGSLEAAATVYEHAASLVDRMRAGYRAEGSKLHIGESATEVYDEAIRTELELHRLTGDERHVERAFRFAEKSKVGILRDALNEAEARSFAGIPQELLDHERKLRIDLAAADHLLTEARVEEGAQEDQLQPLRDRQFALKRQHDALQQRLEKEFPAYYDLKRRFETASPAEIRERFLDEGTVLVEYFLGRQRIVIFTLTRHDLAVASVEREASLEADLHELRRAIVERDPVAHPRPAHRLYRPLLAPVEGRLAGKDLVIVPDGPLSTVPFEALLKREASPDADPRDLPYVLRGHAVSYAYSATVLVQGLDRKNEIPPDELIAFAPLFAQEADPLAEAARPLPASRKEVTDVRRLVAKRQGPFGGWFSGRSRVHLGEDATEARLKSAGLERYRYVHLATHGIVDEEHPGLSRLLLLPEAGSGEDGVVHLGEVYNLRLNADLVVLSACDTGRGRIARGEGIIGLTRGFLYAGARSLLVSLWPVSDAAASALVVDFYEELLAGRPKAHALREAKLRTMGRNPEYARPYYWSSLVLVGDRR